MNFFDILRILLFTKNNSELNAQELSSFSAFMFNRWLSFYDKSRCALVNETLNKFNVFDEKKDQFDFLYYFIPKLSYKKINYIKKTKTEEEDTLNKKEFFSKRETKQYLDLLESLNN